MTISGFYALTQWASAGGSPAADVRTTFANTYGQETVDAIGAAISAPGFNLASLEPQFERQISAGANPAAPTLADINAGILAVGGQTPGLGNAIVKGVEDTGKIVGDAAVTAATSTFTVLKWLTVAIVAGAVIYVGVQTGAFRAVRSGK